MKFLPPDTKKTLKKIFGRFTFTCCSFKHFIFWGKIFSLFVLRQFTSVIPLAVEEHKSERNLFIHSIIYIIYSNIFKKNYHYSLFWVIRVKNSRRKINRKYNKCEKGSFLTNNCYNIFFFINLF